MAELEFLCKPLLVFHHSIPPFGVSVLSSSGFFFLSLNPSCRCFPQFFDDVSLPIRGFFFGFHPSSLIAG